ncbi:uncharacterized protein METZ01_LOCUS158881 [marine metagenome]|uniref:ER-bound oxygenase mpaB/mpaB'/Rubber oxygenase catalytic domain-containing protein n=1 Tax=marine metagenome TaxID=408172 RepID=A0A382AYG9_9ZZZZ
MVIMITLSLTNLSIQTRDVSFDKQGDKSLITIAEELKHGRRWVNREIQKLDPDTDYSVIMSMIAQYQMDEFTLNFLVTILTSYVVKPAHMGETLVLTNKALRRPNQRMQDALDFFWTWYATGPDSTETIESVNRLNKLHLGVARRLPGHFENSEDFIYVLGRLVVLQDRLLKKLGLNGMDQHIKLAQFNFAKALSKHFRREGDLKLEGFPENLEDLEKFVDRWEAKNHVYSPVLTDLVLALIYAFGERWFPRPFHGLGRWIGIYSLEDGFLKHVRIAPLTGVRRLVTHLLLKTLFLFKTKFAADSKISAYANRETLTTNELKEMDKTAVKRVSDLGWTKGGREAMGLGEKASLANGCPIMNHSAQESGMT